MGISANGNWSNADDEHSQGQNPQSYDSRKEFLNYRFSPEELRVIKECDSEAFYTRSVPFSLALGSAAYMSVKNGILKANSRFGPWPKVIGLGFFGFIAGRLSYVKTCQEKMMALPNSRFAEMLRRNAHRKNAATNWDMAVQHDAGAATALSLAPFQSQPQTYSDEYQQPSSLNLDTNRPHNSGFDDTYRPTMEGTNDINEDVVIPKRNNAHVTYDELRQRNRDEFARNSGQSYFNQQPVAPANQAAQPGSYHPLPDNDRRRANLRARGDEQSGPKNRYGDALSD